jgi:TolB-like protein/DNA-binding SARP family transcriptional activator/Tfp pilus assembly protein PilF
MIELRTLGGVDLRSSESGTLLQVAAQPKRLALLVYLALGDSSGLRRRDSAVGYFWPELDTLHARGALRQALHSLRRLIGEAALITQGEEEIGVNHGVLRCDAVSFRQSVEAGRYDDALKLYRGDFLDGFFVSDVAAEFEQWIGETRADLRRSASASAWTLADIHRAKGDFTNAAAVARRASALALEDENGVARLISFLDELGDRSGALDAYDDLAGRLKSDYDAEPSPETQALIDRVRKRTVASIPRLSATQQVRLPAIIGSDAEPDQASAFNAPVMRPSDDGRAMTRSHKRRNRYLGVAAVLILGFVVVAIAQRSSPDTPYSVAVVPLQDLNGDTSRAYVADGVTDQLITDLAQLGTLQVINRRTMMTYRGSRKTSREIAGDLHADAVLSGTIQSLGDKVLMTAQLVLARNERVIWAQTFEGNRGDLLRMQREAARIAAQRLRGVLTPAQQTSLPRMRPMDPEALDLYIKGRYYWNKRGPGLLQSIGLFTQALDLDPTFALAYSGMADAYVQLGYGNGLAPGDAFPKARAAAMRALQLDSTLAEPHAALAFVHMYYDWDWPGAEREFHHAISLNPSYATAHEWYGLFLASMGRFGEARSQETRAEELDPLSVPIAGTAGWVLYYAGDYETAKRELQIVLRMDSTFALGHLYLGRVYQETHDLDSAMVQYELPGPLHDWVPTVAGKGYVFAELGRKAEARATIAQLDSISRKRYVTAYGVALIYAALQQPDSAFTWLDRGLVERTNWMVWLNRDPRWDPIRGDPRFAVLTRKIRLPK